jgi:hypothetical protein
MGAAHAPRKFRPQKVSGSTSGRIWRGVGFATAVAAVIGVGTASAMFVDYLADRAVMRAAKVPKAPAAGTEVAAVVAKPIVRQGRPAVAAAPSIVKAQPQEQPDDKQIALADARAAATPNPLTIDPESALAQSELADAGGPLSELSSFAETDAELSAFAETDDNSLTDATFTGTIPSPKPEVAAPADGSPEVLTDDTAATKDESATGREAKVTTAVNLRAGPKDEAKVLAVVPARETVQLINCDGWCEVVFQGQRGWIYKSFIRES